MEDKASSIVIEGSGPFFSFFKNKNIPQKHNQNTVKAKTKASKAKAKASTQEQNKGL